MRNLFAFCIVFFGWSCAYPLVPKAALVVGDQRMQFIIIASGILIFVSWKLHCQSSYFKTSKSTDGAWFQIFKFLVLAVLLFLDAVLSIALLFCEKIALPVTLAFGLTVGTIIFFVWFWAFYIKWRQVKKVACLYILNFKGNMYSNDKYHISAYLINYFSYRLRKM